MPAKPDPRREEEKTHPPAPGSPGSPDLWATLPPGQRTGDTARLDRTGPYQPSAEPFPRLPAAFGRYRVVRRLGDGGMGSVYLARDSKLDRLVALKVPRFTAADGPQARQRFLREARAAATLQHPNLCPVFDADEIDGTPYLTMAFLEGQPLSRLIAEAREPLPERQVAALARKLALALAEAHSRGVCHRDLKPDNVMLNARGEPVVMDFGLARRVGRGRPEAGGPPGLTSPRVVSDARLTQAGALLGTPAYMAPEQAEGDPELMGPACDVYSLGVILYELLTRRLPFDGKDVYTLLAQVLTEEPKSPLAYRPELDPRLEAICLRALAKRPEQRHRGMAEFAAVLTAFLTATGPATAEEPAVHRVRVEEIETKPPRRRRPTAGLPTRVWAGVLVAGVVLLGVSTLLFGRAGHGEVRVELSDPGARLEVRVDGERVAFDPEKPVLRLAVGQHTLEVGGAGVRPVTMEFPVKREGNPPVVVRIEPTASPPLSQTRQRAKPTDTPKELALPGPPLKAGDVAAAKPTGPPPLTWRSQENLRAGRIAPPPELDRIVPWLVDRFVDRGSGFPTPAKGVVKGYRNIPQKNVYYIRPQGRGRHYAPLPLDRAKPPNPTGPFAVLTSGRVTGLPGRWGVAVGDKDTPQLAVVGISNEGKVILGAGTKADPGRPIEPDPGNHPAVRKGFGVANRLGLVVAGRYLEVYVNTAAVSDPILLPRPLKGTPRISLACVSSNGESGTLAEFEGISVMPAYLKPLTDRGAVPKTR